MTAASFGTVQLSRFFFTVLVYKIYKHHIHVHVCAVIWLDGYVLKVTVSRDFESRQCLRTSSEERAPRNSRTTRPSVLQNAC